MKIDNKEIEEDANSPGVFVTVSRIMNWKEILYSGTGRILAYICTKRDRYVIIHYDSLVWMAFL